ncbi:MAG: Orotidine 5'-phosphate decarboxylase [Acetothermia bacterium 64_32]|nr:MAG: Orotidine 5'-phosphate decarboxylase [Acetothermia bacterium 64_32]HAF69844.1 orotidine-5'-phosphate decarboxylase [Candidatus Acetothermia bacterium]
MIIDRLYEAVKRRGPVCVGLDPSPELLPPGLLRGRSLAHAFLAFNREIVDATLDIVACYKLQIAHYEALGVEGLAAYRDTLRYIRARGAIAIGDVKRGDIASTAQMYARAHFEGDFEADFLTLNPYLGFDSISPFLPYLKRGGKGLFILIRTSNPSAPEFQDLFCSTPHASPVTRHPLYLHVAEAVALWGEPFVGGCGYSLIGGVVGGTSREALAEIRKGFPSIFLLVPGYGAQGATGRDVAAAFRDGNGAVVAAARAIIGAHRGKQDAARRFSEYARAAALAMREEVCRWIR